MIIHGYPPLFMPRKKVRTIKYTNTYINLSARVENQYYTKKILINKSIGFYVTVVCLKSLT
jgi:hypothetical protein